MSQTGGGAHAKRVSLYEAADLPMVDALITEMLSGLVGAETPAEVGAEGA